jgi:hypothetical protein
MKSLLSAIILFSFLGAFLCGFVFWMANSSHQQAEQMRQHGRYSDVEITRMFSSSPSDGSSTFYYVEVQPVGAISDPKLIRCSVVYSTYQDLRVGQKLKAWVLGNDALLDYGNKNAGSVADSILLACAFFGVMLVIGIAAKIVQWLSKRHEVIAQ